MHTRKHDRHVLPAIGQRIDQSPDRRIRRRDMRVVPRKLPPRPLLHLPPARHIRRQHDLLRRHRHHPICRRPIRRMRCLQTHHRKPRPPRLPRRKRFQIRRRPLTKHRTLVTRKPLRLRQARPMQPRIIEQKPTLKTLPKHKAPAPLLRHHHPRMRLAHQWCCPVPLRQMPLPKKRRVIPRPRGRRDTPSLSPTLPRRPVAPKLRPASQRMRDRPRPQRQRIVIPRHPILRRRHPRKQRRPRKRPKRMRRHRLRVVHTLRRKTIQPRRPRIHIPRKTTRLPPPLRRHNP